MKNLSLDQFAGSNFHYVKHTLDYFLRSMVRLDIHLIEFYAHYPHFSPMDATAQEAAALKRKLKEHGLTLCCTTFEQCTYPVNIATEDAAVRDRSIQILERVIEFTSQLECPYTQVLGGRASYDLPESEAWDRSRDALSRLAEKGRKCDVTLVIEEASRYTTNTVYTTPLTSRMVQEVNSPNFKAMLDNCATETAGENFAQCVEMLGPDFRHMHFADGNPGGHFIPGEGRLPLESYLHTLDDAGYRGAVTFELYNKLYEMDPHAAMERCFSYIRGIMR